MRAEIITVGTELLLGQTLNSNGRYLARLLASLGIDLYFQLTVGDNLVRLSGAIERALARADLVITTGGLGPTEDDLTREAIARVTGRPLRRHETARLWLEEAYRRRGKSVPEGSWREAALPEGAEPLRNERGTAPGLFLEWEGKWIAALPGPPSELEPMAAQELRPRLERLPGRSGLLLSRLLRVCGLPEAEAERRVRHLLAGTNPTVAPYAKLGEVHFRITARAPDRAAAEALIAPVEAALRDALAPHVYGTDDEPIEAVVGGALRRRRWRIAVAESCTGGLVAQRLTAVPGSSDYLLTGVVAYANEAKERLLGVKAETLRAHGAVSAETAREMALGVSRLVGSEVAVSVTGIAGPGGGTPTKPVGTVHFAVLTPVGLDTWMRRFAGNREQVRAQAAQEALVGLWGRVRMGEGA